MLLILFVLVLNCTMFGQPLSGIYSIPGDYATIRDAFLALNAQGIISAVTFNVAANHTETATDSLILTTSGRVDGFITFQKSGVGSNPLITRNNAGFLTTSTLGGQGDAVIIIQGCDYLIFDGIDVATTNQGIEYGYYLRKIDATDGCKFVTIKNAGITMFKGTSAYVCGIYSSNNDAASAVNSNLGLVLQNTGGRSENVTITGNTISNVANGILLRGFNHNSPPFDLFDQNFVIGENTAGNILQNFGGGNTSTFYGIYVQNHGNLSIGYNTFDNAGNGGTNATSTYYGIYYTPSTANLAGGNCIINNNNFTLGKAGGTTYGIYTNQNSNSITITSNTFATGTFGSTTCYLIYASSNTNDVIVSYNSTIGPFAKTGSGTLYCFYNLGSPTGGTEVISNNNFSNISLTGTSSFYGIYSGTSPTQGTSIYSNTISDITGGSGTFYGINSTDGMNSNIYSNHIHTIATGGTTYGILSGGTATVTTNTHNNFIHDISSVGNSAVYGISASTAGTNNIYKNNIYNLTAGGTSTAAVVSGLHSLSGTNIRFYNNFVSDLKAPQSIAPNGVIGINLAGGTNASVFFNTVYLNASSSGATFGSSGISALATVNLDMQNNVLVNNSIPNGGAGYTVAFRRSGAITPANYLASSNNNDFFAGEPGANNLIFFDGTNADQTIDDFKTRVAPRDAGSFTEDPPFADISSTPYDLHMQPVQTKCESGGSIIASPINVTDDYDDQPRYPDPGCPNNPSYPATATDVGADEFAGTPSFTCDPPDPGSTLSSANNFCFGESTTLSLQNAISGTGNSFQWQQSPDDITFTDIPDATGSSYTFAPSVTAYYQCVVTCQNGPSTSTSASLLVHFLYDISSSSGGERCGMGTVKLNAAGNADSLAWYTAITGGAPIGYGSPFYTPVISETTTFYVSAETNAQELITVGTGSSTSTTYSNPFYGNHSHTHNQHLIRSDELYAAGFSVGDMTSLGIYITSAGSLPMIDFSLKMGLTTATNLSSFDSTAFTTLFTSASLMPIVGVNTMTFTTPFHWDGISNLLIEICHGNPASIALMSRTCRTNTTSFISTINTRFATDTVSGTEVCDTVTGTISTYSTRPQFFINGTTVCASPRTPVVAIVSLPPVLEVSGDGTVCNDVIVALNVISTPSFFDVYEWTPVDNLFTDPGATVPYTGGSALTLYVRTTNAGTYTYTCNALNNTSFCSNIDHATVTVLPDNPVIDAVPPTLCLSGSSTLSVSFPEGTGEATFQWQESYDGVTYNDISGATDISYTTPWIGITTYYQLIIKNSLGVTCTVPQYTLEVRNPLVTNTVPGFHCGPGTVELSATGTTGLLTWYDSPAGGLPLFTGSPFTTPYLWESQTFYVSSLEPGTIIESAGKITPTGTATGSTANYGMVFTTNQHIILQSVDIYPTSTAGELSLTLYSSSQTILYGPLFFNYPAGNGTEPYTLPLNFQINEGSGYRLIINVISGGTLRRETTGLTYPINTGSLVSLTSAASSLTNNSTTVYNWFYNWRVMYGCASPLTPVLATINLAPFYELTLDQAVCNNETATINVNNGTSYFDTFTWSPADNLFTDQACTNAYIPGTNVPTVYFKTASTGNYEIRGYANNTVNGCTNFDTTHVAVLPPSVTIASDPDSICVSGSASFTLVPAMDYGSAIIQWQVSADNISFSDIPGATNADYITPVITSTTYYKVIIKNTSYVECLTALKTLFVDSPTITGTTPGSRCGTGTVTLGATANPGATIKWYGNVDGGALLGTGEIFTTPVISETQNFYVMAGGASGTSGTFAVPNRGGTSGYTLQAGLLFNVYAPTMILDGVHIYPVGTGEGIVNISLKNSVNQILEQVSFTCTGTTSPGIKTYVPLNWTIPAGYGYYIDMVNRTGLVASLIRDSQSDIIGGPIATNPYCNLDGVVQITSGRLSASGTSTSYYFFYDWQIRTGCSSARVPVLATVNAGNPVNITPSRTICSNEIHMMTVTSQVGDYDVYNWSPADNLYTDPACTSPYVAQMNNSTVYFRSATAITETYTSLGVNTVNGCNDTAQSTVTAMPNPVIVSIPEAICISDSATLKLSPADGYGIATFQWQDSPDNITFTNIPGATNQTYNTPVVSTVSYYRVTIKNAMGVTCSEPSYTLEVSSPQLLSTTPGERCGPGTVILGATGSGGIIKWYTEPIGGTLLGTGPSFTTPFISATTSYFAGVASPASTDGYVGMPASVNGTSGAGTNTYGLFFNALSAFTLRSVNVYPNSSTNGTPGTVTISVLNNNGIVLHQAVVNVTGYTQSSNPNMQTVDLNFNIDPEQNLRLVMTSKSSGISGLMFQPSSQAPYPYPYVLPGIVEITSGTYSSVYHPELYYYFYNWRVTMGCETSRAEVLASVNVPPDLTISGSKTICTNEVYQIDVTNPLIQFDSYTWSPVENLFTDAACTQPYVALTYASTVYFKATQGITTSYTCAAFNSTNLCTNYTSTIITVIPAATIMSTPDGICYSGTATLELVPVSGYGLATFQWQDSPDNITFTDVSGATNQSFTTPTLSTTRYYKMLIKNESGVICTEPVYTMTVNHPEILSTTPGSRCGIGSVVLEATAGQGSELNWYTSASGGEQVGTGSPFATPQISSTTSFYVAASAGGGGIGSVGPFSNNIGAGSNQSLTYHLIFDVLAPSMILQGVYVYPGAAGDVKFYIANSSGTILDTIIYPVTSGDIGNKTYIPVSFAIPAGTNYRLGYTTSIGGVSLFRNTDGATYPYTLPGIVSITGNSFSGYPQYYYYFYDWQIVTGCESSRTEVIATVTPAPGITASASPDVVCAFNPSTLSVRTNHPAYTYVWNPGNLIGQNQVVYPESGTEYTVTATDAGTGCVNMASVIVNVIPTPSPITITPSGPTINAGDVQLLTTTGGTLSENVIFGTATTTNTTTGYPAPYTNYYGGAKHQMLIRSSELAAAGLYIGTAITSVSFTVASVGSTFTGSLYNFQIDMGHTTQTVLNSTLFITGLTNVLPPDTAIITVGTVTHVLAVPFIWNGTSNLVIQTSYSNGNSGVSTDHVLMTNSNPGFVSTSYYRADNVSAATILASTDPTSSGNARPNMIIGYGSPTSMVWMPHTNLYTDPAATVNYNGESTDTVYAKPPATITYTATSTSTLNNCQTSKTVTITVIDVPVVTTAIITGITANSASGGGEVTSDGNGIVTARGVCWSTSINPTIADPKTTDGDGLGTFTSSIAPLSPSTLYHVRAYATNEAGTAYGADIPFNTLSTIPEFTTLQNITVTNYTCFEANNTITVAGEGTYFIVSATGNAVFIAGEKISFMPGTTVMSGGYILGTIRPNGPWCDAKSALVQSTAGGPEESMYRIEQEFFSLYPNPTSGNFTLVQKGDKAYGTVKVEVYSMSGDKMMTELMIGKKKHEFTFSDVPVGLYFVKIIADDYVETIKLVKIR